MKGEKNSADVLSSFYAKPLSQLAGPYAVVLKELQLIDEKIAMKRRDIGFLSPLTTDSDPTSDELHLRLDTRKRKFLASHRKRTLD